MNYSLWPARRKERSTAFEDRLAPHLPRIWRLALRLQGNPTDAEDLVQDLLVRAWRYRDEVLALDAPGPWLARVLYRLHVDRWRRRGVLGEAESLDERPTPDIPSGGRESPALAALSAAELMTVVNELPEPQRVVLLMHDAEGYTLAEIGKIQDVPLGTLKSRLHRARAAVRARIIHGTFSASLACIANEGENHELPNRPTSD